MNKNAALNITVAIVSFIIAFNIVLLYGANYWAGIFGGICFDNVVHYVFNEDN